MDIFGGQCPNSVLLTGSERGISPTVREGSETYRKGALPDGRASAPV